MLSLTTRTRTNGAVGDMLELMIALVVGAALACAGVRIPARLLIGFTYMLALFLVLPIALRAAGAVLPANTSAAVGMVEAVWQSVVSLVLIGIWCRPASTSASRANTLGALQLSLATYVAAKFIFFDIGKAMHLREMEAFFIYSGLPAWMNYAVMIFEIAGAVALLLHKPRNLAFMAGAGLGLLMVGAILTHARNGDPLADSFDAIKQLLFLVAYLAVSVVCRRADAGLPAPVSEGAPPA